MNAKRILISLAGIAVCCGVILAANYGLGPVAQQRAEAEQLKIMQLLTGGETFTKQDYCLLYTSGAAFAHERDLYAARHKL